MRYYVPVIGYEGYYSINADGEVISHYYDIPLKHKIASAYPVVSLYKGGRAKTHTIHRLLATNFIPNPKGLPLVNHINGDTLDFRLENLEWVSHNYNVKDGFDRGRVHPQLGKRYVDRKKICEMCKRVFEYVKPHQRFCGKKCAGVNNLQLVGVTIALDDAGNLTATSTDSEKP